MRALLLASRGKTSALSIASLLWVAACSTYSESLLTDAPATGGAGGTSGSAGAGGSSGSAGASGSSGTAGTAGSGGSSGTAGNAGVGGTSGSAGSSGTSGTGGTAGSSGSAGAGGTSGSSGSGGTAGSGGTGATCTSAAQCPGTDSLCATRTCINGACGVSHASAGTVDTTEATGNCKKRSCDGNGNLVESNDDLDVPADTNNCTNDLCNGGVPSHTNVGAGITCGGSLICDGMGNCTGCVTAADCPGQDTECATRTCNSGVCGKTFAMTGTALAAQTAGDCQTAVCDGAGNFTSKSEPTDVPPDDGNTCTNEACSAGAPVHPPVSSGQTCAQNGGTHCDGMGACVPTCTDQVQNGNETAKDCGGGTCPTCADGLACNAPTDCQSGICTNHICAPVPPTVTSTTPSDGSSGTTPSAISVTFSKAMAPATLTAQTSAGSCSGTIQVSSNEFVSCVGFTAATAVMSNGNTTATLTPTGLFSQTRYKVRVTTGAQSASALPLASVFTHATGFTTPTPPALCASAPVVISQVYGGGGNSGAPYLNDFIELHNRGTSSVSLAGWSVQYAGSTGVTWTVTNLSGSIPAGGFFLVQQASGGGVGVALPTPDVTGSIAMGGTAGKVALVSNTTALSGGCPTGGAIVDFVGYGTASNCAEGTPTGTTSNTNAAIRTSNGCTDTGANNSDFTVAAATPRNSSNVISCGCEGASNNESNLATELDYCVLQAPATLSPTAGQPTALVYGRVYEAGFTDAAGANSQIFAQCGYGPTGSNPTSASGWLFSDAVFNTQYGNDDEYQVAMIAPVSGVYSYTYRFSRDNGLSWTYCDTDGAGSNPNLTFSAALTGAMTVP